jgi:hypothetical protein
VVAVVYLGLGFLAYAHTAFAGSSRLPQCLCPDQIQETWFLAWPHVALAHGHDPLFTTWMYQPTGANLSLSTSFPLLGLLSTPLQVTVGSVAAYNLMLPLALATSALAMCLVLRRWVRSWTACFVGGLLYGFSPYMIGQGNGHLFLTAVAIPPVIFLVGDHLLRGTASPVKLGLLLAALMVAQYGISPEVLFITVLIGAAAVVVAVFIAPHRVRASASRLAVGVGIAAALAAVVLAYPAWFALAGPGHVVGPPHRVSNLIHYAGDLLDPVVPTDSQWLSTRAIYHASDSWSGTAVENGLYLGTPLVVALVGLTIAFRRSRRLVFFAVMVGVSLVLALGTHLWAAGHHSAVPLPFGILVHVPALQEIEADRFSLCMQLFAAMWLACALEETGRRLQARERAREIAWWVPLTVTVAFAVVVLVPLVPSVPYRSVPTRIPAFFTGSGAGRIPEGSVVLPYPYPVRPATSSLLYQAATGLRYKVVGGDATVPGPTGKRIITPVLQPGTVQAVFYGAYHPPVRGPASHRASWPPITGGTLANLRRFLVRYRISTVVLVPEGENPAAAVRYLTAGLGPPEHRSGADVWFDVAGHLPPPLPVG